MAQIDHIVSRLYQSLKLLHHDRFAEEAGRSIELYIDTVDVVFSVVGFSEYIYLDIQEGNKVKLKQQVFNRPQALVDCLLASGWLGKIYLLPPHQAEFMKKVKNGRLFSREPRRREKILDFLKLLGFAAEGSPSVMELDAEEIYEVVRREAQGAEQAFKAVQCVLYRPEERLKKWYDDDVLRRSVHDFNYTQLTQSGQFKSFLDEFEKARSGQFYNNFADAVALMMLRDLCRKASVQPEFPIPRFFDSHGLFCKVVENTYARDDFSVRLADGTMTRGLVDANYLIYRATFSPGPGEGAAEKSSDVDPEELYLKLQQIAGETPDDSRLGWLQSSSTFDQEALDRLEINDVPLRQVIHELTGLSFLKNVWLEQLARPELENLAQRFNKRNVESKEFKSGLKTVLAKTRQIFEDSAAEYERMNDVWHELRKGVETLRQDFAAAGSQDFDAIRDLDLLRFGLPIETKEELRDIVGELLEETVEKDEIVKLDAWSRLVESYYDARQTPAAKVKEAQLAGAALWSMKRYGSIIYLLRELAGQNHHSSVDILYAAACFRARKEKGKGRKILEALAGKLEIARAELARLDGAALGELADLAIGVGYLSFHLWHSLNYAVEWRGESHNFSKRGMDEKGRSLLEQATESARTAVEAICQLEKTLDTPEHEMEMKKVYALNQRLYYLAELGPDDEELIEPMGNMAAELGSYQDPAQDLWQPTFHDTLARYLHFLSTRMSDLETRVELLSEAVAQSRKAHDAKPRDTLFSHYLNVVVTAKARAKEMLSEHNASKLKERASEDDR